MWIDTLFLGTGPLDFIVVQNEGEGVPSERRAVPPHPHPASINDLGEAVH